MARLIALRRAAPGAEPVIAPPIVHEVLRSPGRPLDKETRATVGARFGHDFSQVRLHFGARAAASADAVSALAYTVGNDVVFGAGVHPRSEAGQRVLAHELAHVVQQRGAAPARGPLTVGRADDPAEREADLGAPRSTSGHTVCLRRQLAPPGAPAASAAMSRTEFERIMRRRFGVTEVRTGTFEEQATGVNTRRGVQPSGRITRAMWHPFDPGANSPTYETIVQAFEDFENRVGGLPPVREIVFFETDFAVTANGTLVPAPRIGADFGGGTMRIYRAGLTSTSPLPFGRSTASGSYPGAPVVGVGGIPGQSPGAPLPFPSAEQSATRTITHELGHGLAEQAHLAEPDLFDQYHREIGWFNGRLYDVGIPAVRAAISAGTAPPSSIPAARGAAQPTEITAADWNHPRWVEQPLTHYMVSGGPGEDFAEAVMAYVDSPDLLRRRSPSRYRFLETHRARWLPHLRVRPQRGDFPEPSRTIRVG
jgi:hypothetical protein